MRFYQALALGLCSLVAAGCAVNQNSLSVQDIAALRIVDVGITFKPDAGISWTAAEQEFVNAENARIAQNPKLRHKIKGDVRPGEFGVPNDPVAEERRRQIASPEGKEFVRKKIAAFIDARLRKDVAPEFQGTRDVKLEVVVAAFIVPDAVQRAVIGGTPVLGAITTLRDAKTGVELAKLDQGASTYAGNGLAAIVDQAIAAPLEERLVDAYVDNVRRWLQKK